MPQVAYSFVVDRGSKFAYQAWNLAHSLIQFCSAAPRDIHIQCTPTSDAEARRTFETAGFTTHTLIPFGDKKYCNKLAQLENLAATEAHTIILLDTDTIAVGDLRTWIHPEAICGKIVDAANPPIECLREIADLAGISPGEVCSTDSGDGETFVGNCNGGMYAIPAYLAAAFSVEWQRWAYWLLANPEPLRRFNRDIHVDQVSFWMALRSLDAPFVSAPSNMNYFTHFDSERRYLKDDQPLALLHYHNALNVVGRIETNDALGHAANECIARANALIGAHFNNRLFWEFRYEHFSERGSGVGSRGDNLIYKRQLLLENGIEGASSVLDIGCGDLEIIKPLRLQNYVGVDSSPLALERGKEIFPNGTFVLGLKPQTPSADLVLCFEVLIHQHDVAEYNRIVSFAAQRTDKTLLISGYDATSADIRDNPMISFHEPLVDTLRRTGRFSSISEIGRHTDVVIYRCDV